MNPLIIITPLKNTHITTISFPQINNNFLITIATHVVFTFLHFPSPHHNIFIWIRSQTIIHYNLGFPYIYYFFSFLALQFLKNRKQIIFFTAESLTI